MLQADPGGAPETAPTKTANLVDATGTMRDPLATGDPLAQVISAIDDSRPAFDEDAETLLALKNLEKRRRAKRRKAQAKVAAAIVAAAAVAGVAFALNAPPREEEADDYAPTVAYAERTDFETTVEGTGALNPYDTVIVTPEVDGVVSEVFVKEGQEVHKGDLLFRLKNEELDKAVTEASDQVAEASQDLDNVYADIADQEYAAQVAQAEYEQAVAQEAVDKEAAQAAYDSTYDNAMADANQRIEEAEAAEAAAAEEEEAATNALEDAEEAQRQAETKAEK